MINCRNSSSIMQHVVQGRTEKDGNNSSNTVGNFKLNYQFPIHCIKGTEVREYGYPEYDNIHDAITEALKSIKDQQGGRGITIIASCYVMDMIHSITQSSDKPPLVYSTWHAGVKRASEEEIKMWLKDRGNRHLVTDMSCAGGFEDSTVLVIDNRSCLDNLCLRAVSKLVIVRYRDITYRTPSSKSSKR